MTAPWHDGAGGAPLLSPADPGSYGEAPTGYRLPDALTLGPVHLQVVHLDRSVAWYTAVLGLTELARAGESATLGALDGTPLVRLEARPGTRPVAPGSRLGLYHFAILLPTRAALGQCLRHLATTGTLVGSSDHRVSEALYLEDPDGLGIELYCDRPRSTWTRVGRELQMATDPLDVGGVLAAAGDAPWRGPPAGTVMGHLHLHVGDLPQADAFYRGALGFDRMVWHYPGALFLGAGGYHHQLGVNSWARGARVADERDARLDHWTLVLPTDADVRAACASLTAGGYPVVDGFVRDPWGTTLRLTSVGSGP